MTARIASCSSDQELIQLFQSCDSAQKLAVGRSPEGVFRYPVNCESRVHGQSPEYQVMKANQMMSSLEHPLEPNAYAAHPGI